MSYAKMEVAFPRHFLMRVYTEILGRKPTPKDKLTAGPNTAEVPRVQANIGVMANLLKDHAKAVASINVVDPEFRDVILQGLDRALASKMTAALNNYCVEYKKPHKK